MEYKVIDTNKGKLAQAVFLENEKIEDYKSFFALIMEAPSDTIVIDKERIIEDFFVLRTGFAGEILQKVSNYRKRIVIIGDYVGVNSKSMRDFIFESNRTGKVLFVESLEKGIELLK